MTSFNDMALAEELKKGLASLQFIKPTEIQTAVIETAMEGTDLMACAETGSGKTGAFGIPTVQRLLEDPEARCLIMAPTRELVHQIADFLRDLTKYCDTISVTALVGGADMYKQLRALKNNPRIVVATPGRLNDHIRRRSIKLDKTKILILDEGDRMLDMGFAPQLDEVLLHLPKERQSLLFTATLPKKVKMLAADYLSNPKEMDVGRTSLPVASIKQSIIQMNSTREKDDILVDELNKREGSVIIFFRTKRRVDEVYDNLRSYGFKAGIIHGDRSQGQRNRAISDFKSGKTRILCATDVAARGIDVPSVGHVVNYDLPRMDEDYVHRIGRTARNGAEGEAVSFVPRPDQRAWMMIAKKYQIKGCEIEGFSANDSDGGRPKRYGRRGPGGSGGGDRRRDDRRGGGGGGYGSDRDRSKGPSGRWADSKPKRRDEGAASSSDSNWNDKPRRSRDEDAGGRSSDERRGGSDQRRSGSRDSWASKPRRRDEDGGGSSSRSRDERPSGGPDARGNYAKRTKGGSEERSGGFTKKREGGGESFARKRFTKKTDSEGSSSERSSEGSSSRQAGERGGAGGFSSRKPAPKKKSSGSFRAAAAGKKSGGLKRGGKPAGARKSSASSSARNESK
jgi:ATP-dependent RNA helicase RhlE